METWKEHLGTYELMLWDETRFDINSVLWVKQAVETEMYAFAVDYIRHYAVYTHGGIYLDTDVEVVKPFDDLLDTDLMLGFSQGESGIVESACFGAQKGHPYIKKCMEYYKERNFFDEANRSEIMNVNRHGRLSLIRPIIANGLMMNVLTESFSGANYRIYSGEYFSGRNLITGDVVKTKNTYSVHHATSTYISEAARKRRSLVWKLAGYFGEGSLFTKLLYKLRDLVWNLRRHL
jgi:hypothetical protein